MGTFLVALVADLTGRENLGVAALAVLFLIGLVLFVFAIRANARAQSLPEEATEGSAESPAEGSGRV